MDDEIAGFFQLGGAAGDVPDPRPHMVPFGLGEFPGKIAVTADRVAAQMRGIAAVDGQWMTQRFRHDPLLRAYGGRVPVDDAGRT